MITEEYIKELTNTTFFSKRKSKKAAAFTR